MFNVVERPDSKLVPVMSYIKAAIYSCSFTSLSLFHCRLIRQTNEASYVTENQQALCPELSENFKLQFYPWLLQNSDTGYTFLKCTINIFLNPFTGVQTIQITL